MTKMTSDWDEMPQTTNQPKENENNRWRFRYNWFNEMAAVHDANTAAGELVGH